MTRSQSGARRPQAKRAAPGRGGGGRRGLAPIGPEGGASRDRTTRCETPRPPPRRSSTIALDDAHIAAEEPVLTGEDTVIDPHTRLLELSLPSFDIDGDVEDSPRLAPPPPVRRAPPSLGPCSMLYGVSMFENPGITPADLARWTDGARGAAPTPTPRLLESQALVVEGAGVRLKHMTFCLVVGLVFGMGFAGREIVSCAGSRPASALEAPRSGVEGAASLADERLERRLVDHLRAELSRLLGLR
jgi:hypothetical protein